VSAHAGEIWAEVDSALRRARVGAMVAACMNKPTGYAFWAGVDHALQALKAGSWAALARKDRLQPHQVPRRFEAAFAALPNGLESLGMAEMQQLLRAHGVEVAGDEVAGLQVNSTDQLEHGVSPAGQPHLEQAVQAVDGCHGAGNGSAHGGAL
jgi:hypothetical protein